MDIFMTYVLPILVLTTIGALLALLLAYLSSVLAVVVDPKVEEVCKNLAGVNCGGCGYAGCEAFADALVKGKADVSACNPASAEGKEKIAKILGGEVSLGEKTVAVVHCAGGDRCQNKFEYQGYGDCLSATALAGGNKECDRGCIGLSSCAQSCKFSAISVCKDDGYAIVDDSKCVSCGACLITCPKNIIGRMPVSAKVFVACNNHKKGKEVLSVCEFGCIACGLCVKACPHQAITMDNNLAVIDYSKCTSCGACVPVCPRKTIRQKS